MDTVLTVDVGNTTTRFGLFAVEGGDEAPELLGSCELTTQQPLTFDEARIQIAHALSLLPDRAPTGSILSCVVPALQDTWRRALGADGPPSSSTWERRRTSRRSTRAARSSAASSRRAWPSAPARSRRPPRACP